MKVTVDIDVHDIVLQDLKEHASYLMKEGNDPHEFIGKKALLFTSLCVVIEHYSRPSEWEEFVKETEGKRVE